MKQEFDQIRFWLLLNYYWYAYKLMYDSIKLLLTTLHLLKSLSNGKLLTTNWYEELNWILTLNTYDLLFLCYTNSSYNQKQPLCKT